MMEKFDLKKYKQLDGKGKSLVVLVALGILLPIMLAGVYVVQYLRPQADVSCPPTNIKTTRVSPSVANVSFDTTCSVKAQIFCAAGRAGIQFYCGQDETATNHHIISTKEVTLSTNVGYYIFIDTKMANRTLSYIQASMDDPTYGLSNDLFGEEVMGSVQGDKTYDPALDINQDGVIGVLDKIEFYDDVK